MYVLDIEKCSTYSLQIGLLKWVPMYLNAHYTAKRTHLKERNQLIIKTLETFYNMNFKKLGLTLNFRNVFFRRIYIYTMLINYLVDYALLQTINKYLTLFNTNIT